MSNESGRGRRIIRRVWANKAVLIGGTIIGGFVLVSIIVYLAGVVGISITPYSPTKQNVGPSLAAPSLAHLFGTDLLGRDVFSRVLFATPYDFSVALVVVGFAIFIGVPIGSYAAYRGGLMDEGLMRITDVFFALPALVLAMAIGFVLGAGIVHMTFALMIVWWPAYARLARGEALKVSHQGYIEAARISGQGRLRILVKHIVPNILGTILVYATLDIGTVLLVYSGLSYLGLSIQPPLPDWGQMVSAYQDYMLLAPWLPLFPGLIIALGVVGFSLLGDGIRDMMEEPE